MRLHKLLGKISTQSFVQDYFHRLPFSLSGGAQQFCSLGAWDTWDKILREQIVDLLIVREGKQYAEEQPRTGEAGQKLLTAGFTLLVRHAERHDSGLRELATAFADDFQAPVNIHLYATPPCQHGFSWHYDAEDVFILQTSGSKEYFLRKNTVHPWPLVETIPQDMRYQREIMPLMRVVLTAGDWLYIPAGYWHKAESQPGEEPALSIALGVLSPAAITILDHLRTKLVQSIFWRQRLPVAGNAAVISREEQAVIYRDLMAQLQKDLCQALADPQLVDELLKGVALREIEQ